MRRQGQRCAGTAACIRQRRRGYESQDPRRRGAGAWRTGGSRTYRAGRGHLRCQAKGLRKDHFQGGGNQPQIPKGSDRSWYRAGA